MYQITLSYLYTTLLAPNAFRDRFTILYVFMAISLSFYPKEEIFLRHICLQADVDPCFRCSDYAR